MRAWTQLLEPGPGLAMLCIVLAFTTQVHAAPTLPEPYADQSTEIEYYPVADATGCYYNFQHYDEGDRIITNEPCLNCTCHNRMLMCYLRVCPFTKAIGANCKVEKRPDQCCPTITCPEVPVHLVTSTAPPTALGHLNEYGCSIDGLFYSDGARVPSNPENPCELCYCIRNKTACVMQECTLNVEGCRPVFQEGVCCPVRYNCEHPNYLEGPTTPQITTTTTTTTTTEAPPTTLQPFECDFQGQRYNDGELVKKDIPCEKCYCMRGDIVCAVQECGPTPLDKVNCTALPVREGQCCPETYDCAGVIEEELTTLSSVSYETEPTTQQSVFEEKEQAFTQQPLTTAHIEEEEYKPTTGTESAAVPEAITKATLAEESEKEQHPVEEDQVHEAETSTPEVLKEITSQPEYLKPVEGETHVPEIESTTPEIIKEITKQPEKQQPIEPEGQVPESETKTPDSIEEITKQPEEQQPVEPETETKTSEPAEEITKRPGEEQPVETEGHVPETATTTPKEVVKPVEEGQTPEVELSTPEVIEGTTRQPELQKPAEIDNRIPEIEASTPVVIEEITEQPAEAPQSGEHITEKAAEEITTTQETSEGVQETESPDVAPVTRVGIASEAAITPEAATEATEKESHERPSGEEEVSKTTETPIESITSRVTEAIESITSRVTEVVESITTVFSGSSTEEPAEKVTEPVHDTEQQTELPKESEETTEKPTEQAESDKTGVEPVISDKERPEVPYDKEGPKITDSEIPKKEISVTTENIPKETEGAEEQQTTEADNALEESGVHHDDIEGEEGEQETEIPTTDTEKPLNEQKHETSTAREPATSSKSEAEVTDTSTTSSSAQHPEKTEEAPESDETKPTESEELHPAVTEPVFTPEECGDKGCANVPKVKPTDVEENQMAVTEPIIKSEKCNDEECARVPIETQPLPEQPSEEGTTPTSQATEKEEAQTETISEEPVEEQQPTKPSSEGAEAEGQVTEISEPVPEQQPSEPPEKLPEEPVTEQGQEPSEIPTKQPIEKQRPETERPVAESESLRPEEPQTTEEEMVIITEIPVKKTELPESMDHVSETAQSTETPKERLHPTTETATEKDITETNKQEISSEVPEIHAEGKPMSTELPPESEESQKTIPPVIPTEETKSTEAATLEVTEPTKQEEPVETSEGTKRPQEEENEIEHDAEPPKEEENEIEHDESEITVPKTEEHVTEGEISEADTDRSAAQPTTESVKPDEGTKEEEKPESVQPGGYTNEGEEITEKAIVPEVCTSETECAPGIIPSIPKSDQLPESSSFKPEEITEISESATESNKIPEAEVHTEETNEIPENSSEEFPRVTEKSGEESSGEKPTEVPVKEEEGSGEAPEEGSGSTESFPEATAEPETVHKIQEPSMPEEQEATRVGQEPEHPVETEAPLPHVHHEPSETEQPSVSITGQEPESTPTTEHPEQTELPEREIPGEGSCLVDGQTYKNNSSVPPINHCQASCKCVSSILRCESIECTPPPAGLQNCIPIFDGPNSCCPIYSCTGPETTSPMESDSYVVHSTPRATVEPEITSSQVTEGEISGKEPETATEKVASPEESATTELPSESEVTPKLVEEVTEEIAGGQPEEIPIHTTQKVIEDTGKTESHDVQQPEEITQHPASPDVVTAHPELPEEAETDKIGHLPEDNFVTTSKPTEEETQPIASAQPEEGTTPKRVEETSVAEIPGSEKQPEIVTKVVLEGPDTELSTPSTEKVAGPATAKSETELTESSESATDPRVGVTELPQQPVTELQEIEKIPASQEHVTPATILTPELVSKETESETEVNIVPEKEHEPEESTPKETEVPVTEIPVEGATELIIKEGKPHVPGTEEVESTKESEEPIKPDAEPEEGIATTESSGSELHTEEPFEGPTKIPEEQTTEEEPSIGTVESEISKEPAEYVTESEKTAATNIPSLEAELHVSTSQEPFEVVTEVPEKQTTEELLEKQPIDGTGQEEHTTSTPQESEEPVEHITVPAEKMGTSKPIESDSHVGAQEPFEVETKTPVEQTTQEMITTEVTQKKGSSKGAEGVQHTTAEPVEHDTAPEKEKDTGKPGELEPRPTEAITKEPMEQTTERLRVAEITPERQPSKTTAAIPEGEKPVTESGPQVSPQKPSDVGPEVVSESQPSGGAEEQHTTVKSQESEESGPHVSVSSEDETEIPVVETTEAILVEVASEKEPSKEITEHHTAATPQEIHTAKPEEPSKEGTKTSDEKEITEVIPVTEESPVTQQSEEEQHTPEHVTVPEGESSTLKAIDSESHVTQQPTVEETKLPEEQTTEQIIVPKETPKYPSQEDKLITEAPQEQPQQEITKKPSEYETATEEQVKATQTEAPKTPSSEVDKAALGTERIASVPSVTEEYETQTTAEVTHVPSEVTTSPAIAEEGPSAITEKSDRETSPVTEKLDEIPPVTEKPSAEDNEIPGAQTEKEGAGQPTPGHEVQPEIEKSSDSTQQPETPDKEGSEKETEKPSIADKEQTILPSDETEQQTEQPEEDKTKLHEDVTTPKEESITEYVSEVQTARPQPQDITEHIPELQTAEPHPHPETTGSGESEEPSLPEETAAPAQPEKEVTISGESATSVPTVSYDIQHPSKEGAAVPEHPSGEEEKVYGGAETERPSISEEESKPIVPSETELPSEKDKTETVSEEHQTEPTVGTTQPSISEETETGEAGISEKEKPSISDEGTEAPTVKQTDKQVNTSEAATPEQPIASPDGTSIITKPSKVPIFTSPEMTTPIIVEEKVNATGPVQEGMLTSGPADEVITKKYDQLSTSAPVSQPTTILPATTSTEMPPSHIPGEQVPESTDYDQPGDEYDDEDQNAFGPGTCRYGGKVYVSAQQIPRDDPCDFCFCFRSDIICLQQSCPPPIPRCHEEPIRGFCCPRYECPVSMATAVNVTTSTTTTTTTLPPHFLSHAYKGRATKTGCQISGKAYKVGDVIRATSGPCLNCTCGGDGQMKCDPKPCSPEPMLRQMIAAAALRRRR